VYGRDEMEPSEWGLEVEENKLISVMRDKSPSQMHSFMISDYRLLQLFGRMQYPKV